MIIYKKEIVEIQEVNGNEVLKEYNLKILSLKLADMKKQYYLILF